MQKDKGWLEEVKITTTLTKEILANLSIKVRTGQFNLFKRILKPIPKTKILDVGVDTHEILKDSNLFEKIYKYPENITAATIEDAGKFRKLYPKIKTVQITPNKKLPFKNNEFDVVVSWATLEHVGSYKKQERFINELLRVGRKIFITTPWRGCIYEPHSGFFFLHWLPLGVFRRLCKLSGQKFWATANNLNPLYVKNIKEMKLRRKVKMKIFRIFNFLPTHIIIYSD